jgi:hypothetical protein
VAIIQHDTCMQPDHTISSKLARTGHSGLIPGDKLGVVYTNTLRQELNHIAHLAKGTHVHTLPLMAYTVVIRLPNKTMTTRQIRHKLAADLTGAAGGREASGLHSAGAGADHAAHPTEAA